MKTLEQILKEATERRTEQGDYGIKACKDAILFDIEWDRKYGRREKTLFEYLEQYYYEANESTFFNNEMVLACWELINER